MGCEQEALFVSGMVGWVGGLQAGFCAHCHARLRGHVSFLSFFLQAAFSGGIQPQDASTVRWSVACGRMVRGRGFCGRSRLCGRSLGERPLLPPRDVGSKSKVEKVRGKGTWRGGDGLSAATGRELGERDIKVLCCARNKTKREGRRVATGASVGDERVIIRARDIYGGMAFSKGNLGREGKGKKNKEGPIMGFFPSRRGKVTGMSRAGLSRRDDQAGGRGGRSKRGRAFLESSRVESRSGRARIAHRTTTLHFL